MSFSKSERLTLENRQVYGWTMYPGYFDRPYRSPVILEEITPVGGRSFHVLILNIFYAAGVQIMPYFLRTLRREKNFIFAEQISDEKPTDRVVVIERMTQNWVRDCAPNCVPMMDRLFDPAGRPVETAFAELAYSL